MMRRLLLLLSVLIVLSAFINAESASAQNWYAGNRSYNATGISASINTPTGAPYMASGTAQASWVSLPCCNWVQSGWAYVQGWSNAQRYVEHNVNGVYGIIWDGTQSWGSAVTYQVRRAMGSNNWNGYIAGVYKGSWGPFPTSSEVQALSEVQTSSSNQLSTTFSNVQYRNSVFQWYLFGQGNWTENSPYKVSKYQNYYYHSWGP
jgi:hypothetical protein